MLNNNQQNSQFAPLYNRRERWRILLWTLLVTGLLAIVMYVWILPWFKAFLPTAHCQTILGMNGLTIIMILMFVISPLILVLFLMLTEGPKSWRVYQLRQTPLPGEKVMKPTRYRYGRKALQRPFWFIAVVFTLMVISVWALLFINGLTERISDSTKNCLNGQIISLK